MLDTTQGSLFTFVLSTAVECYCDIDCPEYLQSFADTRFYQVDLPLIRSLLSPPFPPTSLYLLSLAMAAFGKEHVPVDQWRTRETLCAVTVTI